MFGILAVNHAGIVAIVLPNLGRSGGMRETIKFSTMAAIRRKKVAPHLYCGLTVSTTNIQFATAVSNCLVLESIPKMEGFHNLLLIKPLFWEDGFIIGSDAPGLGVELNEDVERAHT